MSELIVLGAYFNFALFLPTGARESAEYLFHSPLFIVGFFIAGLVVPLVVETYGIFFASHSNKSKSLLMLASTLVLVGGYLLRLYVLNAGLYQYPW